MPDAPKFGSRLYRAGPARATKSAIRRACAARPHLGDAQDSANLPSRSLGSEQYHSFNAPPRGTKTVQQSAREASFHRRLARYCGALCCLDPLRIDARSEPLGRHEEPGTGMDAVDYSAVLVWPPRCRRVHRLERLLPADLALRGKRWADSQVRQVLCSPSQADSPTVLRDLDLLSAGVDLCDPEPACVAVHELRACHE